MFISLTAAVDYTERFPDMYTFSELIWNIRKVGKIDSRKMQGQSAFSTYTMIVLFPESEPQFTKILLIAGGPHGKKTEIVDLSNPDSTCDTWPSYPKKVDGAFGALMGTTILICGGEG